MKLINKYIMFAMILLFGFAKHVNAAPINAYITSSSNSATLVVSSSEHIGQIYGTFSCGEKSVDLTFVATATPPTSKTYTISNLGNGSYTCSVSGLQVGTMESATEGVKGYNVTPKTINNSSGSTSNNGVGNTNKTNYNNNTKKTETKSSNNYLKSYAIDGYKISPDFDKNKTDYTLTVPNGTTKVKILAYQESNKAKLSGDDGEVEVKEGENKLSTTVIAEDGSKKTYNINIIVESKPIIVKLNSQEYTLIKNKDELPNIDLEHEDMSLNFEGVDIPAYRIDKIGYMLVGLKDKDNNTKLYEYVSYKDNEKPEEYHLFNYLKINNLNLIILDFPTKKIPSDYKQYIEKIGDNDYTVYKLDKDSNYSLIYATNFDTGKNNIYKYEKSENTIQIYEKVAKKESVNNTEKYKKLILIMGIAIIILVLLTTIGFTKKPKIKKVKHEDKELTKKDIKKIEKSTKKENKKNKKRQRKGEPEL